MTASCVSPMLRPPPAARITCTGWLLLCLSGQSATAADVLVITDIHHPVQTVAGARVIELDLPQRIEADLASGLPADSSRAASLVQQRLLTGGQEWQQRIAVAYQGVTDAWGLGIAKVPAVVVDRQYVVYGEPDVARALARIEAHRRQRP